MKVLFIQDNGYHESLGICSLAGMLTAHGVEVDLALLSHERNLEFIIKNSAPNLIALSSYSTNVNYYLNVARIIKEKFNIPIIMGGPHPTYYPDVIHEEGIDIICRGEGEYPLLNLINKIEAREDYSEIENLWVKKDGDVFKNDFGVLIENLDELPKPYRQIYYKYRFLRDFPLKRFITGLGCPYKCSFCHEPLYRSYLKGKGKFVRRKSPQRVIEEIIDTRNLSKMKSIHFSDDIFVLDLKWLNEFSELYHKSIGVRFTANVRFDSLNEETIRLLKDMGCAGVAIGLESGNDLLRNKILMKNVSREEIENGADLLHKNRINFLTYNMTALPGETLDMSLETLTLNRHIKPAFSRIYTFQSFPALELTKFAKENNLIHENAQNSIDVQTVNVVSEFETEMRNLCSLFWILIKIPLSLKCVKFLLKLNQNIFFRIIGWMSLFQEPLFYGVSFFESWLFFKNVFLVKNNKASFHWIVPLKVKRTD